MQIKKYSLLVLFGLFLVQTIVPMDGSHLKKEKEKVPEGYHDENSIGNPAQLPMQYDDIDPKLLILAFNHAPEKVKKIVRASKIKWGRADSRNDTKVLLLVGPPGVGKTLIAQAIALQLNYPYRYFNATKFSTSYQHSKIQLLRENIEPYIKQDVPIVIILDEITHLTENHNKKETRDLDPGSATALWLLIDEIARSKNVWLIGTTNYMDSIPEQLKQRVGQAGLCEISSPVSKREIILYHVKDLFDIDEVPDKVINKLERNLQKKTPREIKDFVCCLLIEAKENHPDEEIVTLSDVNQVVKEFQTKEWKLIGLIKKGKPYYLPLLRETIIIGLNVWANSQNLVFGLKGISNTEKSTAIQEESLEIQKSNSGWEGFAKQVATQVSITLILKFLFPGVST